MHCVKKAGGIRKATYVYIKLRTFQANKKSFSKVFKTGYGLFIFTDRSAGKFSICFLRLFLEFYAWNKQDLGRIHLPPYRSLTDDSSVKRVINKTFFFFIRFWRKVLVSSKSDGSESLRFEIFWFIPSLKSNPNCSCNSNY